MFNADILRRLETRMALTIVKQPKFLLWSDFIYKKKTNFLLRIIMLSFGIFI